MARLLYLMPGAGAGEQEERRREKLANSFLTNPANSVVVDSVDDGPASIESSIEGDLSIRGSLVKAIAARGHYDALIIGCGDDPGLFSLRELLDIPVVGPLEASIALSSVIGDRFAVMTIGEDAIPETRLILRRYGAEHRCASIRVVGGPVAEMMTGVMPRETIVANLVREAENAIGDGASSAILACMTLAYLLVDEDAKHQTRLPIINPAKVAVKTAEMLVSLGLRHSELAYPRANLARLRGTVLPELNSWTR